MTLFLNFINLTYQLKNGDTYFSLMAITSFLPGQCAINVFFYIVSNQITPAQKLN